MAKKVTAFQYDSSRTGASAPVSFGGALPGTWEPGVPMLASAFGLTDEQMRDAISEYNLPIEEVSVAEKDAVGEIVRVNHAAVETASLAKEQPSDHVRETAHGPIPALAPSGAHPPLSPLAAAMQARDTAFNEGDSFEEAARAAEKAGGAAAAEIAAATRAAGEAAGEAATLADGENESDAAESGDDGNGGES